MDPSLRHHYVQMRSLGKPQDNAAFAISLDCLILPPASARYTPLRAAVVNNLPATSGIPLSRLPGVTEALHSTPTSIHKGEEACLGRSSTLARDSMIAQTNIHNLAPQRRRAWRHQ